MNVSFTFNELQAILTATYTPRVEDESHKNIFHGGLQCAIMDASMCCLLHHKKVEAVTAKLDVRFRKEVSTHLPIHVSAKETKRKNGFYFLESAITQEGVIKSSAKALFKERFSTSL